MLKRYASLGLFLAVTPLMAATGPAGCSVDSGITMSAAALCGYYIASPPAKPGPITKSTYAAILARCAQPLPTDEPSALAFIEPVINAYLQAKLSGK